MDAQHLQATSQLPAFQGKHVHALKFRLPLAGLEAVRAAAKLTPRPENALCFSQSAGGGIFVHSPPRGFAWPGSR